MLPRISRSQTFSDGDLADLSMITVCRIEIIKTRLHEEIHHFFCRLEIHRGFVICIQTGNRIKPNPSFLSIISSPHKPYTTISFGVILRIQTRHDGKILSHFKASFSFSLTFSRSGSHNNGIQSMILSSGRYYQAKASNSWINSS